MLGDHKDPARSTPEETLQFGQRPLQLTRAEATDAEVKEGEDAKLEHACASSSIQSSCVLLQSPPSLFMLLR